MEVYKNYIIENYWLNSVFAELLKFISLLSQYCTTYSTSLCSSIIVIISLMRFNIQLVVCWMAAVCWGAFPAETSLLLLYLTMYVLCTHLLIFHWAIYYQVLWNYVGMKDFHESRLHQKDAIWKASVWLRKVRISLSDTGCTRLLKLNLLN
jgi:hypothetical protein